VTIDFLKLVDAKNITYDYFNQVYITQSHWQSLYHGPIAVSTWSTRDIFRWSVMEKKLVIFVTRFQRITRQDPGERRRYSVLHNIMPLPTIENIIKSILL